ncbi:hypothetical protein M407DRAFT_86155 [Tulasnella calospora MUT 4182]|uniref:T6SS Phospholipase effector Tle1-like catalytic domain-containing protein n=1 Tax=Tulasnella calospora MUT 4182 TaxID=1051891 RepID=A0A0C3Q1Y8_9AGAM|nr:hypothetical protein M407DRAFT_86155 [Tulasnella calospora MUT 4182]
MPRALVLCFDGTGDSFDDDCTNVVRFVEALEKRRPDKQIYYYQPGIGTSQPQGEGVASRQWVAKKLDQALAWYLDAHIMGGYRFLMENYQEGDKICMFGFSRGAYTARCLAGMVHKVGLLPRFNEEHLGFAYRKYLDHTPKGRKVAQAFKRAFSISVPIEFVGVWDTVASVGWTFKHLPFTDSNTIIRRFRHALALDEHRVEFMPNPWHVPSKDPNAAEHDPDSGTAMISTAHKSRLPGTVRGWLSFPKQVFRTLFMLDPVDAGGDDASVFMLHPVDAGGDDTLDNDTKEDFEYHFGVPTDVQEVWFAGCHADVGGGSTQNNNIHTLANPSLQWMVSEVLKHAPYVLFRPDAFTYDRAFSTYTQNDPKTDANAPKNDQLVKKPVWLILEYIPIFQYYQDGEGIWHWRLRWNARRPREIYDSTPCFHASVKLRRDYEGKWLTKFIPKTGEQIKIRYVE